MNWEKCIKEYNARKITVDKQRAKSLKKMANNRKKFIKTIPYIDSNLIFIFESHYTLLIELIHSLAYSKGYEISNHICLGCFLLEFYQLHNEERMFNKLRKQRNNIVYYGGEIINEIITKNIKEIKNLIQAIENICNNLDS